MPDAENSLALGEFARTLDERHRVSIPPELLKGLAAPNGKWVVAKERRGCLSVWPEGAWKQQLNQGMKVVAAKMEAGSLKGRVAEVQLLGRMLSTGHKDAVELDKQHRLLIPEGFREFLGIEPGGNVLVIGAAVCVELWRPDAFTAYVEKRIPRFRKLLEKLSS